MPSQRARTLLDRALRAALFGACLLPALRLGAAAFGVAGQTLGPNPVTSLLHACGRWALNFLMLTLCMSPLKEITGYALPLRLRRMLGLFAFFYLTLHLTVYVGLDQDLDFGAIGRDIVKRPYITIGFLAFTMLVPLALTSTRRAMRRLGRRWTRLHQLIYPVAILGVWHYWWQVKRDVREPLLYACGLGLLLGYRWVTRVRTPVRFSAALRVERDRA